MYAVEDGYLEDTADEVLQELECRVVAFGCVWSIAAVASVGSDGEEWWLVHRAARRTPRSEDYNWNPVYKRCQILDDDYVIGCGAGAGASGFKPEPRTPWATAHKSLMSAMFGKYRIMGKFYKKAVAGRKVAGTAQHRGCLTCGGDHIDRDCPEGSGSRKAGGKGGKGRASTPRRRRWRRAGPPRLSRQGFLPLRWRVQVLTSSLSGPPRHRGA